MKARPLACATASASSCPAGWPRATTTCARARSARAGSPQRRREGPPAVDAQAARDDADPATDAAARPAERASTCSCSPAGVRRARRSTPFATSAEQNGFGVTRRPPTRAAFTEANLERYRAVVFAGTSGDVLSDAQQAAFEALLHRRRRLPRASASAIATEPDWPFLTDVLGARAKGAPAAPARGDDQGRRPRPRREPQTCRSYWRHTDAYLNFDRNVRGVAHVLATVDEQTYAGGTMGVDHPIAWCKDYKGGRSFYTGVGLVRRTPTAGKHLAGRDRVDGRRRRPRLQRLRRDGAGQLPADEDLGAAEPQRADRLRRAARRPRDPDRARRPAAPARPGEGRDRR